MQVRTKNMKKKSRKIRKKTYQTQQRPIQADQQQKNHSGHTPKNTMTRNTMTTDTHKKAHTFALLAPRIMTRETLSLWDLATQLKET
jgi:hypothetical protein